MELLDIAEGPVLILKPCAGSSQFVTHACGVGVGVQRDPPWLLVIHYTFDQLPLLP